MKNNIVLFSLFNQSGNKGQIGYLYVLPKGDQYMKYIKIEEPKGDYWMVYFTDSTHRKQGELFCYKTEGKLPTQENLLYVEEYKDDLLVTKKWIKWPELVLV